MEAQDTIDESDSRKSYLGYVSRFFLMNVDKEYIPLNFLGAILAIGREYVSIWLWCFTKHDKKGKKFRVVNTSTK